MTILLQLHGQELSARIRRWCLFPVSYTHLVLDKIIDSAQITKDDFVLEIGPGIGTMTQYLACLLYTSLAEQALKDIISPDEKKVITPDYIISMVAEPVSYTHLFSASV